MDGDEDEEDVPAAKRQATPHRFRPRVHIARDKELVAAVPAGKVVASGKGWSSLCIVSSRTNRDISIDSEAHLAVSDVLRAMVGAGEQLAEVPSVFTWSGARAGGQLRGVAERRRLSRVRETRLWELNKPNGSGTMDSGIHPPQSATETQPRLAAPDDRNDIHDLQSQSGIHASALIRDVRITNGDETRTTMTWDPVGTSGTKRLHDCIGLSRTFWGAVLTARPSGIVSPESYRFREPTWENPRRVISPLTNDAWLWLVPNYPWPSPVAESVNPPG
ncbi:hypothetical protein B0H19DRAFT_1063147 [Mycena capillaripes]|nr:hypothetical protein B0H19DRAFT_1063147 [Mycena capillaripes]